MKSPPVQLHDDVARERVEACEETDTFDGKKAPEGSALEAAGVAVSIVEEAFAVA
jgi:hypothetical protein